MKFFCVKLVNYVTLTLLQYHQFYLRAFQKGLKLEIRHIKLNISGFDIGRGFVEIERKFERLRK